MAKEANIPNYGKMRKEELCEALGLIEKAGPYVKKTVAPRSPKSPKTPKEVPKITKRIDAYVKKHHMDFRSVKESFKPPPGMSDYYYLWINDGKGTKVRNYAVPYGTLINTPSEKNIPFAVGMFDAYIGSNPRNRAKGEEFFFDSSHPLYGKGLGLWIAPSPPLEEVEKDPDFEKYLRNIKESLEKFRKTYKPGYVQSVLRRAGKEYEFS